MLILAIKTNQPEAEISLHSGDKEIDTIKWLAHRELSVTIHKKIETLLKKHGKKLQDVEGIVCLSGPGSFTGLRIGLSVANALAYGLQIPIVGSSGNTWQKEGIDKLSSGQNEKIVIPEYGQEPHITQQKK